MLYFGCRMHKRSRLGPVYIHIHIVKMNNEKEAVAIYLLYFLIFHCSLQK